MLPADVLAGDIILSYSKSWLSKGIRFFEKLQTGHALFSHAAVALDETNCIEALGRVRVNPLKKYEKQSITLWRLPLTDKERLAFRNGILLKAGDSYGITKIPLFALDGVCSQIGRWFGRKKPCFWFTRKAGIFNIQVCSQLVVYGLHKFTSYRLRDEEHKDVQWREVSPDYFSDLLNLPHNKAQLIYSQVVN